MYIVRGAMVSVKFMYIVRGVCIFGHFCPFLGIFKPIFVYVILEFLGQFQPFLGHFMVILNTFSPPKSTVATEGTQQVQLLSHHAAFLTDPNKKGGLSQWSLEN